MKIKNILSLVILINFAIVSQIFTMEETTKEQIAEETAIENIEKQKRYEFFKSHPEIFNLAKGIHSFEKNATDELPMEIRVMIAEHIVDIEAIKNENGQALLAAIKNHNLDEAKQLLKKHSININVKDDEGNTALILATKNNYTEIVQALLQKGANLIVLQDKLLGRSALVYAAQNNNAEIVQMLLLKGANPNSQDTDKFTALNWAAWNNNTEIVQMLLEKDANPNLQDIFGMTALHRAVISKNPEIVQMLLLKGANPNLGDKCSGRRTVLDIALKSNYTEIAVQILQVVLEKRNQTS